MPPIKGRMMGLQTGRMSGPPQSTQSDLQPQTVTNIGIQRRKARFSGRGGKTAKRVMCEDSLNKLRIPKQIIKTLPSVKKFSHGHGFVDMTEEEVKEEDTNTNVILGLKKGRGASNKYHIRAVAEKRFTGIVWDVKFCPHRQQVELLVSCGEGVFICDEELSRQRRLDNIRLAGGIGYLSDGRIVAICRCMDLVNIYTPEGDHISEFACGDCPMGLCVTTDDELLISDCLSKEVRSYQVDGTLLHTIPSRGPDYNIRWPLYMDKTDNGNFVLVDCHQQNTLVFDTRGRYMRTIPTRTYGGNEVLRPHGLCVTPAQDLFIIDNAINTLEVFSLTGKYLQTLIPTDEGGRLQPKVVACAADHMVIGGLKGHVRLFKFVSDQEAKLDIKLEMKQEVKEEPVVAPIRIKPRPKGKLEMKRIKQEMSTKFEIKEEVDYIMEVDDDVKIEAVVLAATPSGSKPSEQSDHIKKSNATKRSRSISQSEPRSISQSEPRSISQSELALEGLETIEMRGDDDSEAVTVIVLD